MRIYGKIGQLISAVTLAGMVLGAFSVSGGLALAASTPTLSATGTGDGNSVQVNVTGADYNASVILHYQQTGVGQSIIGLGSTNSSGSYSNIVSTSGDGIVAGSNVYVTVDGAASSTIAWPIGTTSGNFSLSQTGVVLAVGQSTSISVYNSTGTIYLSNNSNPAVANLSISGTQITIYGNTYGSTTASLCMTGNSSSCASLYITVGNSSTTALTFSISNVTVSPGQSVPITISGGNGSYTVLNNSNSSVIQASISNTSSNIINISTNSTSGSAAITICSSNMSTCGIINATASTVSTSPITFSQTNPTVSIGQSLLIGLSGGSSSTYYVSANSSPSIIQTSISGSTLTLVGETSGSSTITVCSSSGSCGTLSATVGYTSNGGQLALSQSTASLLVGQVLSITVSGGMTPYSLGYNTGTVYQASLNGNILTISGISVGSSTLNVCSAGSNCVALNVIVNNSGSGTPIVFSPSSAGVAIGNSTVVTMTGTGGYYLSNSTNPNIANVQINGNAVTITGLQNGNENLSICESGGQCSILFVAVGNTVSNTSGPSFSQSNPSVGVGQSQTITLSGASGSYYVSANSNPTNVAVSLVGSNLTIFGQQNGTSSVTVCATGGSCSNLAVTVGSGSGNSSNPFTFAGVTLPNATVGQAYSYQLVASGGSGIYTFTIASGSLPQGLTLSNSGFISGTPATTGTNNITITGYDTSGAASTQYFSIVVSPVNVPATPVNNSSAYPSGQLINENGTISIVYMSTKTSFTNAAAFLGLGYKFVNVATVANSGLASSGHLVSTSLAQHPWGAWILSGGTVYFVSQNGLIPVPNWSTFLNNGGQSSFIVPANNYDMVLPQLSNMTASDSRV
jgi:ferredoxin